MTSREIFEAWYHPNFFVDPKTLAWEAWKQSRKALADEQAQEANSRIGFLYEELRKAIDEGSESMTHDDALKQIAYWQDKDEQAQAVEPATGERAELIAKYRRLAHAARLRGQSFTPAITKGELLALCDMLEADAKFKPDWVGYRQGVEDGKAEAQQVAVPDDGIIKDASRYAFLRGKGGLVWTITSSEDNRRATGRYYDSAVDAEMKASNCIAQGDKP